MMTDDAYLAVKKANLTPVEPPCDQDAGVASFSGTAGSVKVYTCSHSLLESIAIHPTTCTVIVAKVCLNQAPGNSCNTD